MSLIPTLVLSSNSTVYNEVRQAREIAMFVVLCVVDVCVYVCT